MAMTQDPAPDIAAGEGEACIPFSVAQQVEFCHARGWTDGLPVIPATQELVDDMLEAAGLAGDTVLAEMPSRNVSLTAEKVAINAVMAGCKPEYMPVVAAAVKGLAAPEFGLHHVASGHSGATTIILVNGPIAKKLGINAKNNLFGPGVRANAAIGRALRLVLLNCLRYHPATADAATFGTPGKYTCCIAENEDDHPWEPWHVECGFKPEDSVVTLLAASTMTQIWNFSEHEQLLRCVGDAMSFLGSIAITSQTPGAVIFGGEHAQLLRRSGWNKKQIREFIVAHSGRTVADLKRAGRVDGEITAADETKFHYALDAPEELMLICAGSPIGLLSMVLPGFGGSKAAGRSRPILIQ
ncbi:MAG: hypothetical protein HY322_09205 [Betaproteobacteria bacterium]|nr:hypothetical protein [Betaproteobacteria bacterium]